MKIEVLNTEGKASGKSIDLPDEIFGIEPNEHAVYLAVKSYQAAQRQGTHKSKEKGEVTKSTRKIKRQKGTGTARAGSMKSPLFKGGGTIFGPKPHKYSVKLNKKVKRLARYSALSAKVKQEQFKVIENFTFDAPKTKSVKNILSGMEIGNKKSVIVLGDYDKNVQLSGRNLQETSFVNINELNTYHILRANTLVMTVGAIEKLVAANS